MAVFSAFALAISGCGGSHGSMRVSLSVNGATKLMDAPLDLRVRGLRPHEHVLVQAQSTDAAGKRWNSRATFAADSDGVVDPSQEAPLSGSYRGTRRNGLLWSMLPASGPVENVAFRVRSPGAVITETITVFAAGKMVARRQLERSFLGPDVTTRRLTVSAQGIDGIYFSLRHPSANRPAVVLLGGSEGGLGPADDAALLASHGYPSLSLAYFDAPGLPQQLRSIPLEYFARALHWLGRQRGVAADRLFILGVSRGSEPALLTGAHWPALVHATVALVPSDVTIGSYPGCSGPAWTLHGRPLPYQCHFGPKASPAAAMIPVQQIRGRILLACGGSDEVWPSCPMARAIVRRRDARRSVLLAYPNAGHGIGNPLPNLPISDGDPFVGASAAANEIARQAIWPQLLRFVANG